MTSKIIITNTTQLKKWYNSYSNSYKFVNKETKKLYDVEFRCIIDEPNKNILCRNLNFINLNIYKLDAQDIYGKELSCNKALIWSGRLMSLKCTKRFVSSTMLVVFNTADVIELKLFSGVFNKLDADDIVYKEYLIANKLKMHSICQTSNITPGLILNHQHMLEIHLKRKKELEL